VIVQAKGPITLQLSWYPVRTELIGARARRHKNPGVNAEDYIRSTEHSKTRN